MLGRRDPQRSFFGTTAELGTGVVEKMGFYGKIGLHLGVLFKDDDFGACYDEGKGRPSVPPSILAAARLLQHYASISDAEVVSRCCFDLRWKFALDLDLADIEAPFAKSTFQAFRARLTLHAREAAVFEMSVQEAKKSGILPKKLMVALDSSPVRGRGAVKDTFNLLSDAIAQVVQVVAKKRKKKIGEVASEVNLERHVGSSSIKGSEFVNWEDEEEVGDFLARLLDDCGTAVDLAANESCATREVELLKKVIEQDVETAADNGPRIKQGVAKGRIPSISDPEMRHGHKSSGKKYTGHKAHVAVDTESGVITAVEVSAPGVADGKHVGSLIEQTKTTTGNPVDRAIGDSAYGSREAISQAGRCNVEIKSKMPSPPKGKFGPSDFKVSDDGFRAFCPAGIPSTKSVIRNDGRLHQWPAECCSICEFKDQCLRKDAKRRTLCVPSDFHDRRRREMEAKSIEGRTHLRKRICVEHAIGCIKNLGAGTARYFGQAKTESQWLWAAAALNLMKVFAYQAKVSA